MNLKNKYSIAELDEQYPEIAYMLKHVNDTQSVFNKGIPDEVLEEAQLHDVSVKQSIKENKSLPIWRRIRNEMIESGMNIRNKECVAAYVLDYHLKKDLLIRDFQIMSTCQTILLSESEHYKRTYILNMLDRIS